MAIAFIFWSMNKLIENTQELEILSDMLMVGDRLSKWKKKKPTDEIIGMSMAFARIVMYVNQLQMERKNFDLAISNVKKVKNEQIVHWRDRARLAEKALENNPLNL